MDASPILQETELPISGNPGTWPTAAAIDNRIAMSEKANGRTSPLHGTGALFIQLGRQYGINPGFVCALLQRESQLAADGSILPTRCNNFGGNTWGGSASQGASGKCAAASGIAGREWKQFRTPQAGLDGVFQNLNSSTYRSTGGRAKDVIEKYAPAFENDHTQIFLTFASVGSNLGITLNENTNIYTNGGGVPMNNPIAGGSEGSVFNAVATWLTTGLWAMFARFFLVLVGAGILIIGLRRII